MHLSINSYPFNFHHQQKIAVSTHKWDHIIVDILNMPIHETLSQAKLLLSAGRWLGLNVKFLVPFIRTLSGKAKCFMNVAPGKHTVGHVEKMSLSHSHYSLKVWYCFNHVVNVNSVLMLSFHHIWCLSSLPICPWPCSPHWLALSLLCVCVLSVIWN